MKEYIEYNTKQGITDLLSEIELDDEKGWVEGMHKGEMIASVKLPNNNFNYNEKKGILYRKDRDTTYILIDSLKSNSVRKVKAEWIL